MALYRQNSTGFVQEHASNPGAGYTLIASQPTDTLSNRVNWWRDVDKGSFDSAWHPSLQTGAPEYPGDDTGAGRGVNILPNDYASFEWPGGLPPTHTTNATIAQGTSHLHGDSCARVTLTSSGGTAWLSASGQYNIVLAENSKWIMSWYVKPTTAVARTASIKLVTANGTYTVSGTTDGSTSWQRLSGVFDLTNDAATEARIGLSLDTTSLALDFDALMLEEQIGRESTPSPFYSPWGFGIDAPEQFPDYGIPTLKLYQDLQDRIDLIDGDELLDGSVNARLASQYDTLIQQVNQLAVGNGQFDSKQIWYFDTSADITGWTNGGCTLAVTGGYLIVTGTGATPFFRTSTLAIEGAAYQLIRMRVKRTAGTGWTGTLTYYYGSSSSGTKTISEPTLIDDEYVEVDWDMSAEAAYTGNTITGVRIQLGTGSGDTFSIDWMGVGRNAPGASFAQLEAVRVLSDNKNRVFYQTSAPASDSTYTLKTNDLWFDSDDGSKPYRWTGSAWAETTDTRLADSWAEIVDIRNATANPSGAAAQRINAISAASVKTRTYYQTAAPTTGMVTGDLWFDTDDGNKPYRYSGSAWVETTDTRITSLQASVANKEEAKVGYCSINPGSNTTRALCLAAGGTWTDQPFATAVKQVSVTNANGTASIETNLSTLATDTGALKTQYSVKLDVNGYVAGFGLYNAGAGASGFLINADKFAIGKPGSTTVIPFYVDATANTAYINNAVIKNLAASNIAAGAITADRIDSRGLSIKDASGNVILAAGTALTGDYIAAGSGNLLRAPITWLPVGGTTYGTNEASAGDRSYLRFPASRPILEHTDSPTVTLSAGTYTFSFRGYNTGTTGVNRYLSWQIASGATVLASGSKTMSNSPTRYATTFTLAATTNVYVRLFCPTTSAKEVRAFDLKLETGSAPTPWLANVADVAGVNNPITSSNVSTFIANAAIDKAQIGSVNADTITTGTLNASLVNVTNLNAGSITAGTLNANKVTVRNLNADTISANAITTTKINGSAVTTDKIGVGEVTASGGYSASVSASVGYGGNLTFWTPGRPAVSYGRGKIAFTCRIMIKKTVFDDGYRIATSIQIGRNGVELRTYIVDGGAYENTLSIPVIFYDDYPGNESLSYTFRLYNYTQTGITFQQIDEFWVEYKR